MKEDNEINFPALCKELRKRADLTQREMGERLGVTLRSYQRYEAGDMKPSAEAAFRLAQMYVAMNFDNIVGDVKGEIERRLKESLQAKANDSGVDSPLQRSRSKKR